MQTPQLRHARAVLCGLSERPGLAWLPATEALATLECVFPPLPSADELVTPNTATVEMALAALSAAADVAQDPGEAARIALAAESLRTPVAG